MRLASLIASAAGILVLLSASGVSAQSAAEAPRAGWYVGGGIGAPWPSNLAQSGWNRDPICYPTDACFDQDPRPEIAGYRWHYDIAAATGPVFELSTGLFVDRARVELSFRQRWNDLDQMFLSVTNYEGVAREDRGNSTVTADTRSSPPRRAAGTAAPPRRRGATPSHRLPLPRWSRFNPRPRTGGNEQLLVDLGPARVSIRAPARGATRARRSSCRTWSCFNPRPRTGGDEGQAQLLQDVELFQSAPPHGGRRWT